MAKDFLLLASPNVDATAIASKSSPSENMLNYLQKVVPPHTSVCITTAKQKNCMGKVPRQHKLKPISHDVSDELTSLSVIATDDT